MRNGTLGAVLTLVIFLLGAATPASAEPVPSFAPDEPGPFAAGRVRATIVDSSRDDRTIPLEIWYPVDPEDAEGAEPTFYAIFESVAPDLGFSSELAFADVPASLSANGHLIVFSHGSGGINTQSITLMEALATHGFVVASPAHTGNTAVDNIEGTAVPFLESAIDRPQDVSFTIDEMFRFSNTPGHRLEGTLRDERVGVAGHSFGGYTALAMAAGFGPVAPDPRVTAIMPIAPALLHSNEELATIDVPTFLLSGTLDQTTPIDPNTILPWRFIGHPSVYRADIIGADHTHFANICAIANVLLEVVGLPPELWPAIGAGALIEPYELTCTPEVYPVGEAQRIQAQYAVAFFRTKFSLSPSYREVLTEAYAAENEPDVDFFGPTGGCGKGFEVALLLPAAALWRRRRRATDR